MQLSYHLILFAGTWLYEVAFSLLRLRNFLMQQPAILNTHCGAFRRALRTNRAIHPF